MRHKRRFAVAALAGLVVVLGGCKREAETAPTPAPATQPEPTTAPPTGTAPTAPAAPESTALPPAAGNAAKLSGVLLTPKAGVQILLPDNWEQKEPDDGSLAILVRREPIGGVNVTVTFDYTVCSSLAPNASIESLRDEFSRQFTETLAERNYKTLETKPVSIAGHAALAMTGDLDEHGTPLRTKQLIIQQAKGFWCLGVVGPRDAFDKQVVSEFDAIAASLQLPPD
ncbi:MAG: hypothetical protein HYU66_19075 [Armatimonadetes bacterium]|nr:hypothetical protein [Armatimonadota bacterium]